MLKELKSAIGDDVRYQMIADKVGNTVLQCAIYCYNDASDRQIARDALALANQAKLIVISKLAKDRCSENLAVLQKAVDNLPPKEVSAEAKAINEAIANTASNGVKIITRSGGNTYSLIDNLLISTKPHLQSMKKKLGADNSYYLMMSTRIANVALSLLISFVNSAQDFAAKLVQDPKLAGVGASVALTDLKDNFENAWRLTLKMDELDMTDEFRERYNKQRSMLQSMCSNVGVATPHSSSSSSSNSNGSESDNNSGCIVMVVLIIIAIIILSMIF